MSRFSIDEAVSVVADELTKAAAKKIDGSYQKNDLNSVLVGGVKAFSQNVQRTTVIMCGIEPEIPFTLLA